MQPLILACALLAACGRVDFDVHGDASIPADTAADTAADSSPDGPLTSSIQYAGVFVTRHPGGGANDMFTATAHAAGDVVVMQLGCGATGALPTSATVSSAWNLLPIDNVKFGAGLATTELLAVAPDTNPVQISISWIGTSCDIGTSVLADEFSGVDTSNGGTSAYTARSELAGTGNCQLTFNTVDPAETIWAACFAQTPITGIGPGYTAGAANGGGDQAEYRITTDPSGAPETPMLVNSGDYIIDVIELKSR